MGSGATKLSANMNLIQAVTDNKVEWVVKLVAEGADVNFASINNWTPLHYACKEGHACIVETLLTLGADRDLLTKVRIFAPGVLHHARAVIYTLFSLKTPRLAT